MTAELQSYQQALDEHAWRVPERYNIARTSATAIRATSWR